MLITGFSLSLIGFVLMGPMMRAHGQSSIGFDATQWEIKDDRARRENYLGRDSLYLTSGYALLKGVNFENGVIEVDIAAPNTPSFVGIVFRAEGTGDHEIVYFRPHKSGLEDAVQYTPAFNGQACWQLYSGPGFTAATDIPKDRWIHARIEINGRGGRVFFNNSEKPVLVIEDLKRGLSHGTIGLWGGVTGGHFANFSWRAENSLPNVARAPLPAPAGTLTSWELSEAFDTAARDPETPPTPKEISAMKWQPVTVEVPGMLVVNRYRAGSGLVPFFREATERVGKRTGRKAVFARTTINSDRDQLVKMSLGYSDEVTVLVNSKPVFTGHSAFRFRDPGFLGIMDVENDVVYLPLRKGRNELMLGVADYFGGWGFICRLDGASGVTIK